MSAQNSPSSDCPLPRSNARRRKSNKNKTTSASTPQKSTRPAHSSSKSQSKKRASPPALAKLRRFAVAAFAAVLVFFLFFDIGRVRSDAMAPALRRGDIVLSWNPKLFSVGLTPGDIALIRPKNDGEKSDDGDLNPNFLRCIASNSEDISFNQDVLQIGDTPVARMPLSSDAIVRPPDVPERWRETLPNGARYEITLPRLRLTGNLSGNLKLSPGAFFLAGDNRSASLDSRQNGAFDQSEIRGRALFVVVASQNDGFIGHLFKIPQ